MTTKSFVLVLESPSEERCTVTEVLASYTSHSKAKAERARLNRIRAERVALRAATLVGRMYFRPVGMASSSYESHTEASARKYADYDVPRVRLVVVSVDGLVANEAALFARERY